MDIKIYTGCYSNCKSGNLISISGDKGKKVNFDGKTYPLLAPKLDFWTIWHENIGIVPDEANNDYYIREYCSKVLAGLNAEQVIEDLGIQPILLCYEDGIDFCHRHIVAAWLELELGVCVQEIKTDTFGTISILDKLDLKDKVSKCLYSVHTAVQTKSRGLM